MPFASRVVRCRVKLAAIAFASYVAVAGSVRAQSTRVEPTGPLSAGLLKAPPSRDSLAAISRRGFLLAQYDFVAWAASDSVTGRHPSSGLVRGYVARRRGDRWEVAFGRLSTERDTFYIAFEARQRPSDDSNFDVAAITPPRADTGYYVRAARAIAMATADFGKQPCPYNPAVLERDDGTLLVYLMPAQLQLGVYPLGADVRYLFQSDGRTILAKRRLHNMLLQYGETPGSGKLEASTHSAVLDDIPEDTDVFHVLVRQPQVPEYIVTDAFLYRLDLTGEIHFLGRRSEILGEKGKGAPVP
ncbi:MAG TPA: hypothetical protein VHE78_10575 [Gemmatimonadaceae bacterium]|nr:hypothetical protein [Gemmatimonadaceae bacterium]